MAFAIEMLTDYYVSTHKRPTQEVAGVSSAGPAPMIIQGFAYAAESSVFMVLAIVIALLVPLYLFNPVTYGSPILSFYGIALVGLGLLTTTGFVLAMDTFGPISDNAQGVYEMSGEGHDNEYGSKAVQRLDAAGNTTKALTKGFAIATAVVAAVALFHSFLEDAQLGSIGLRLDIPEIFLGLLIGGAAPYLFSAFSINAVGRASFQLINEVRRQFRADPGIMAGTSKPNYGACVSIVTSAAQKELLGPGILAIFLPIAVAFGFSIGKTPTVIGGTPYNLTGAQALGGFLAGAILSGQLMAVLLANSGGMWDNAKKIIEDGLYGGKGTEAHKAGVVCDTVGDPFKDTAGPAMNPLIKVMNLVALLLAPVIIRPFDTTILSIITGVSVLLLVISIYFSKRGSLSTEMMKATDMAHSQAETHHDPSAIAGAAPTELPPAKKKRITVEEDDAKPEE
jgi:K(+)-stimulated pyrophosphate-energized sodium pump